MFKKDIGYIALLGRILALGLRSELYYRWQYAGTLLAFLPSFESSLSLIFACTIYLPVVLKRFDFLGTSVYSSCSCSLCVRTPCMTPPTIDAKHTSVNIFRRKLNHPFGEALSAEEVVYS